MLVAGYTSAERAKAAEEDPGPPAKIVFRGSRPTDNPEFRYTSAFLGAGPREGKYYGSVEFTRKTTVYIHGISRGDLVGLVGAIYRVASVGPESARFFILEPDEIPRGVQPPKNESLVFPVVPAWVTENAVRNPYPRGSDRLNDPNFRVMGISTVSGELRADLQVVEYEPAGNGRVGRKVTVQQVPVGGLFSIAGKKFRVRCLVPPDSRTKIVGWVEMDPEPVE
jgi:hypothetical protein